MHYTEGLVFRIVENLKKKIKNMILIKIAYTFGNLLKTMPTNFGSLHNV
jgi:hypothetical protein